MEEQEEKQGENIGDFEWKFVLAVALLVDGVQFIIEWFDAIAVGLIINRLISIAFALVLLSYVLFRRAHMDMRAWMSLAFALLGELIPIVGAFPLFSMDVAYIWSLNSKNLLAQAAGTAVGNKLTKLPPGAKPTLPPRTQPPPLPGAKQPPPIPNQ